MKSHYQNFQVNFEILSGLVPRINDDHSLIKTFQMQTENQICNKTLHCLSNIRQVEQRRTKHTSL